MSWDDTQGLPPATYNQQFLDKLAEAPGEFRKVGDNFVKDRLREGMVFNKIIPQTEVRPDQLQVSLESDTMYEVIHLEPNAAASIADFRGMGRSQVVRGKRVPLTFHRIQSDVFEIVEEDLLVYPYPIVRLIHEFSIKDIGDVHDLYMIQNAQRSVDFVDADAAYKNLWGGGSVTGVNPDGTGYTDDTITFPINSASFVRARKAMSNRIAPSKALICKADHDDLDSLDVMEQGDVLRSEVFINGYRQPKLNGIDLVVTTKQDIFRPGNVWLFAAPDMLGFNKVLDYGGNPYKLFIDRRGNLITWHVWALFGALFANVGSVVKLELYTKNHITDPGTDPKDVNPTNITEDDLFQKRNLADQGGRFPTIRQF